MFNNMLMYLIKLYLKVFNFLINPEKKVNKREKRLFYLIVILTFLLTAL